MLANFGAFDNGLRALGLADWHAVKTDAGINTARTGVSLSNAPKLAATSQALRRIQPRMNS
jgi:hypothetical protein